MGVIFGLLKFLIFFGMLEISYIFWVNGRCEARAYVHEENMRVPANPHPLPPWEPLYIWSQYIAHSYLVVLILFSQLKFPIKLHKIKCVESIVSDKVTEYTFQTICMFLFVNRFVFANSADLHEMSDGVAFHIRLYFLSKFSFIEMFYLKG